MNVILQEITALSEAYWKGRITAEKYYRMCAVLNAQYVQIRKMRTILANSTGIKQ